MKTQFTAADVTPDVKAAVRAYLLARTHAEVLREAVDVVEREVLQECPLSNGLDVQAGFAPHAITEPKKVYLCTDQPILEEHWATVDQRLRERGIKPANMDKDHCPALVAERIQTETEWLITETAGAMLGMADPKALNNKLLCLGLDERERFLDLVIRLVVNLPDFKPPELVKSA